MTARHSSWRDAVTVVPTGTVRSDHDASRAEDRGTLLSSPWLQSGVAGRSLDENRRSPATTSLSRAGSHAAAAIAEDTGDRRRAGRIRPAGAGGADLAPAHDLAAGVLRRD